MMDPSAVASGSASGIAIEAFAEAASFHLFVGFDLIDCLFGCSLIIIALVSVAFGSRSCWGFGAQAVAWLGPTTNSAFD